MKQKKYTSRGEFKKGCDRAWRVAKQNGWINEMKWLETNFNNNNNNNNNNKKVRVPAYKYDVIKITLTKEDLTKEKIIEISKNYSSRTEFYKGCRVAYEYARINHLLDELFIRYNSKCH